MCVHAHVCVLECVRNNEPRSRGEMGDYKMQEEGRNLGAAGVKEKE